MKLMRLKNVCLLLLVFIPVFAYGDFFQYSELNLGIEKAQPFSMCGNRSISSHSSESMNSNISLVQNIYTKSYKRFQYEINAQITHHSCVFNNDKYVYDGYGLSMKFRFNY